MKVNHLFSAPVWEMDLDFDHELVAEKVLELKSKYPDKRKIASNVGGWQSKNFTKHLLLQYVEFNKMYTEMENALAQVANRIHPNTKLQYLDFWFNVSGKESYNADHMHQSDTGICLSGVVYIKTDDETGNIVFYDDYTPNRYYKHIDGFFNIERNFFKRIHVFKPNPCKLLIFPAWLRHSVEKSNSDSERISIAFNIQTVHFGETNSAFSTFNNSARFTTLKI